jgi:glycerate kinase
VLVAPDRFGPTLTSVDVADLLSDGWLVGAPGDTVVTAPLSDGGPGLVAAVHRAAGGDLVPVTVPGPDGQVPAALLRLPDGTVVVEVAEVLGPRVPVTAPISSGPVLGLLEEACRLAEGRVVVGVGGLAVHDAGAGLLAALGVAPVVRDASEQLDVALDPGALPGLVERAAERFADILAGRELVVAVDTEVPLLGLHGASALLALPDATGLVVAPTAAQGLESAFGRWVHALGTVLGPGRVRALAGERGAGAGGGLALGLSLLGGQLREGPGLVAELVGLPGLVADADLVVTAAPVLDPHVLHDSPLAVCSAQGAAHALPVVVITGEAVLGRRESAAQGLSGVYALADGTAGWQELGDLAAALRDRATRVARTWSR